MSSATAKRSAADSRTDRTLRNVETFASGTVPGREPGQVEIYSDLDVQQVEDNFHALSTGENPAHRVPVVVTHDGKHAYGWVNGARKQGGILVTDWDEVDPGLKKAIKDGKFKKVSAELKRDFADGDGNIKAGWYLYRVAVIGADVPRVKGLADIPAEWFTDPPGSRIERIFKFADPPSAPAASSSGKGITMDFATALAFLQSKGIPGSEALSADKPPDDATQKLIVGMAQALQQAEQTPAANSDGSGGGGAASGTGNPKAITYKFADDPQFKAAMAQLTSVATTAVKQIKDANDAARGDADKRAAEERVVMVRTFADDMAKQGRISPADNDEANPKSWRSEAVWEARQSQTVREFADPADEKKTIKQTRLDGMLERVRNQPARKFSEKVAAGSGKGKDGQSEKSDYRKQVEAKFAARYPAAVSKN